MRHDPAWDKRARAVARMPAAEFLERYDRITDPKDRLEALRLRFRYDLLGFARWCWPDLFSLPWNPFHREDLGEPLPHWKDRVGHDIRDARAAPRGIAKTTLIKARMAHAMAYGLDPYMVTLSATLRLALDTSNHLKAMVSKPETPFAALYGPVQLEGAGGEWSATWPDGSVTGMLAASFGTQVRGANHHGQRPTLITVDDGERSDRVRNPEQRHLWHRFLSDDVQKAGPKEGGLAILWRGTVLHPDAVLARLLKSPGWSSRRWQAMPAWPVNSDLWEECRSIWADLTLGDLEERRAAAEAFYLEHREAMDEGAEVLDPVAEPLFRLFEYIWSDGLASFLREKQNEPRDPDASIFVSQRFTRHRVEKRGDEWWIVAKGGARVVKLSECSTLIRWDPSMGDPTSDYAALVLVARDKYGYGYVVAVWMRRRKPSIQLASLWEMAERFGVKRASLESNGFQSLIADEFRRQRNERREQKRFWQLEIDEDPSTTDKGERIAGLEPVVTNGWLSFAEGLPPEFLTQWDDFPSADHDDGPDATEGAWARIGPAPRKDRHRGKTRIW